MRALMGTLIEIGGGEGASILLFDPQINQFTLRGYLGPAPLSVSIPYQHPIVLWLRREGHFLAKRDLMDDPHLLELKPSTLAYFSEWSCEIAFPLITERKFHGIFNLGPRRKSPYDKEDLELFTTLMNLGSVFIENSHLYGTLLEQNVKMTEVARLKTQFVSNITHELRTPLHGILGLAGVVLEDPQECLPEDYRRYLEMMKNSGEALLEIVDHILDLTKYQSGLVHLNIRKIDLKNLIDEVYREMRPQIESRQCTFDLNWPELTPGVYGDEVELKHLIKDLISNAIKFTSQGIISISSEKSGEMLRICVQDNGIGIEDEDQYRIFEDFQQAENDVNRSFGGSGLGLPLAKKIVELHGGRMWVESKKGVGSRFYFTLPLNPSRIQVRAATGESNASSH